MVSPPSRLYGIDLLKGLASQIILLHHMSTFGPVSEAFAKMAPALTVWFFEYGRMAVQVFLVMGGFLAARGFAAHKIQMKQLPGLIARRYLRLWVPYIGAVALAVIVDTILANIWLGDPTIPVRPPLLGMLINALMLQDILGFESMMAGGWYIAIDFQLFALMAILLQGGRASFGKRAWTVGRTLILALTAASLFFFNRNADLDIWAIYFIGSYGLGAAAWWFSEKGRSPAWMAGMAAVAVGALVFDFRVRIVIALVVALALAISRSTGVLERWPKARVVAFFGRISFALFLVHFPILLLANEAYARLGLSSPFATVVTILAAWAGSIGLATIFHRLIEAPAWDKRIWAALTGR
jgi:peptidoglycan/LPS O-acetylase OafA/YrhL